MTTTIATAIAKTITAGNGMSIISTQNVNAKPTNEGEVVDASENDIGTFGEDGISQKADSTDYALVIALLVVGSILISCCVVGIYVYVVWKQRKQKVIEDTRQKSQLVVVNNTDSNAAVAVESVNAVTFDGNALAHAPTPKDDIDNGHGMVVDTRRDSGL